MWKNKKMRLLRLNKQDIILCDICKKIIDSNIRELNISSATTIFYQFHLHKDCIVDNSIFETLKYIFELIEVQHPH